MPAPPATASGTAPADQPYVLVLGTAQDAGLPQIAARHALDRAARADPALQRFVSSILIVDPRGGAGAGRRWLIDATPHLAQQVELAEAHPANRPRAEGRPPLFEGIFLTHAHMGHVAGLLQLGREAYAAEGQVVYGSKSMRAFLGQNQPWRLLVDHRHIVLAELAHETRVELAPDLFVTPIRVPHRAEVTDTFAFRIDGPGRSALFVPDIDKWQLWERDLASELAGVDVALLDGSFYGPDEVPGRSMDEIPHPFMVETLELIEAMEPAPRARIVFTHLNHTNPAGSPDSPERRAVDQRGAEVAERGSVFPLGAP